MAQEVTGERIFGVPVVRSAWMPDDVVLVMGPGAWVPDLSVVLDPMPMPFLDRFRAALEREVRRPLSLGLITEGMAMHRANGKASTIRAEVAWYTDWWRGGRDRGWWEA